MFVIRTFLLGLVFRNSILQQAIFCQCDKWDFSAGLFLFYPLTWSILVISMVISVV